MNVEVPSQFRRRFRGDGAARDAAIETDVVSRRHQRADWNGRRWRSRTLSPPPSLTGICRPDLHTVRSEPAGAVLRWRDVVSAKSTGRHSRGQRQARLDSRGQPHSTPLQVRSTLGASPRDIIAIMQALKAAGALACGDCDSLSPDERYPLASVTGTCLAAGVRRRLPRPRSNCARWRRQFESLLLTQLLNTMRTPCSDDAGTTPGFQGTAGRRVVQRTECGRSAAPVALDWAGRDGALLRQQVLGLTRSLHTVWIPAVGAPRTCPADVVRVGSSDVELRVWRRDPLDASPAPAQGYGSRDAEGQEVHGGPRRAHQLCRRNVRLGLTVLIDSRWRPRDALCAPVRAVGKAGEAVGDAR